MADDVSVPSEAQPEANALASANNAPIPIPSLPKSDRKIPTFENSVPAQATQQAKPQQPVQPSPTPPPNKIPTFESSAPAPPQVSPSEAMGGQPNNDDIKKYINMNMKDYFDQRNPGFKGTASNWMEAFEAGIQTSVSGLMQKRPEAQLPTDPSLAMRIASQVGTLAGDMPYMMAAGFDGAPGASFAAPAAMRKLLMDKYEKGEINSGDEFVDRLIGASWEGFKGYLTGELTAGAGGKAAEMTAAAGAKPIVSEAAKFLSEVGTMTTVSSALEGHLPDMDHFTDAALVMGGLHAVGVLPKLQNIYTSTGEHPTDIASTSMTDPIVKQQMMSHDMESPPQATPMNLEYKPIEEPKEGEPPKIEPVLVPKDLSIPIPPRDPNPPVDRSPEMQATLDKIGVKAPEEAQSWTDSFNERYAKSVDWTDPQKVAYAAWKDMTGKELPVEDRSYVQSRLFAAHNDFIRRVVEEGVPDESGKYSGRGINSIYKDIESDGLNQADFDGYSINKRAIEQYNRGIKPWKDFDPEAAQKVVDQYKDKYEDYHQERVQMMNDVLNYGVKKGVLDPDKVAASIATEKDYIPMNKMMPPDELTGMPPGKGGSILKKFQGDSDLFFENPRAQILNNISAIIKRADVNDIRLNFLDKMKIKKTDAEGNTTSENPFVREVSLAKSVKVGDNDFVSVLGNLNPKTQIAIYRDGQLRALEGTPLVIDSLKRLEGDPTSMNLTMKVAKSFATSLRMGTILDPSFGFRHFFRSAILSGVYSETGQIPFIHPLAALPEFLGKSSPDFKDWMSNGGATQGFDELDKNYIGNGLEESNQKAPFLDQVWNVLKHPLEASESFIKLTDNLTRFTEYKRAVEQGKSPTEAAFLAREVTPDFMKTGLERSALRTLTAFQGAHVTSLARMGQAFNEDPMGTSLKMAASIMVPSLLLYAANYKNKNIEDLPDYQKDLYWNVDVGNLFGKVESGQNETIIKLPKPWGPGIFFGSGIERTFDAYFKDKPDSFKGYLHDLWESFVPPIIPSGLSPVLEHLYNRNLFKGTSLVNESQQKLLPELQYSPYTSPSAIQMGKLCGYVPLVKDIGPSSDPLCSPQVIENYIRGWTGTLGAYALKIGDEGLRAAGVIPKNTGMSSVETPIAEYPILNGFMTRFPTMKTQPVETFYDNLDETNKVLNSIKVAQKTNNTAALTNIMSKYPGLEPQLKSYATAIAVGKKTIQYIQDNPQYDPVQKRQAVDSVLFQIGSIANQGNKMMQDFNSQVQKGAQ